MAVKYGVDVPALFDTIGLGGVVNNWAGESGASTWVLAFTLNKVHAASRSNPPRWGSIRFRLAPRTYDAPPCALSTCGESDEIKTNTHPKNVTALFAE